jgi:hypothetical protein
MERKIDEINETMKIRKAIIPFLADMFNDGKEIKISKEENRIINFNVSEIKKAFNDAIKNIVLKYPEKQKVEIVNHKEVQKVEVLNQEKFPEIKIEKNEINFPELQKIIGEVKAINLPIGTEKEASKENANPTNYLIVRLSDGQKFIDSFGGGVSAPMGRSTENIYLREEYDYTTISGIQVVNKVRKWTDTMLLTEDYIYDNSANPIKKFRSIEPYNAV